MAEFEAIILDTETTGIEEGAEVIELYWSSFEPRDPTHIPSGAHQFYYPHGEIELGALCAHHIFKEELVGSPPSSQVFGDIPKAKYWIGHNVDFDWKMLRSPPVFRICTLAMGRTMYPTLDKHTLSALSYHLYGRNDEVRQQVHNAHGAKADVALCKSVLLKMIDHAGIENLDHLYAFSENARIPRIMSFGKYKGQPVSAVDKGWANWYARQSDTDEYLMLALRRAGKL